MRAELCLGPADCGAVNELTQTPGDPFGAGLSRSVHSQIVGGARTVPVRSGKNISSSRNQDEQCRIRPAALRSGTGRAPAPAVPHRYGRHRLAIGRSNNSDRPVAVASTS